jgi:CubicO group peptidase (beta-lactamase class C family)
MTGTFTGLLLQDMVERGEMQLDDPAAKYLPNSVKMPTHKGREITLYHLAKETSGLPDFANQLNPKRADNPLADFTVEKMYAFVSVCQLTNDPGTKHFHGCSVDRELLSQAMASKAGTNYETLMAERIFLPLRMDSTRFTLTPELKSRLAREHSRLGDVNPIMDWGVLTPQAGLYSTAKDLLKFVSAFSLVPSSLTASMEKSVVNLSYNPQTGERIHTGGGGLGGRSYACYDKTRRRGVVILSTSADLGPNLGDFLLESEWQSDRRPAETNINRKVYGSYVGQYRPVGASSGPDIGVRREGDRLFAQATGSISGPSELLPPIAAELLPESETCFFERLSGRPITFSRNLRGEVDGLTMDCQGKVCLYKRISDRPPKGPKPVKPRVAIRLDPKLLDVCVGHYEFAPDAVFPTGMKLKIWREGDHLVAQAWCEGLNVFPGAFDIYPESETIFFDRILCAQYIFVKDHEGKVTAVTHRRSGLPESAGKKLEN